MNVARLGSSVSLCRKLSLIIKREKKPSTSAPDEVPVVRK